LFFYLRKTGGFFIECGALDGETRSNTLYLERFLGWRGLLVEANPSNVEMLKKINRKAWLTPTCLSIKPYPVTVNTLFMIYTHTTFKETAWLKWMLHKNIMFSKGSFAPHFLSKRLLPPVHNFKCYYLFI
jgi:hypothetical protein